MKAKNSIFQRQNFMARHRRSRSKFKKLSDAVFTKTGLPLSRLLSILAGLLVIGGLVAYSLKGDSKSAASAPETPLSQFDTNDSEELNFLNAGTLPPDFTDLPFPVQLEKLDNMILHCRHLIDQDNNYRDETKGKLISLLALKCIKMSENSLDPTSAVQVFESTVAQVANSEANRSKYSYLNAFVHMSNLAFFPNAKQYENAIAAIALIDESTPVLPSKAVGCYNSALQYHLYSEDKVAATKLLRLLGNKMAMAKEKKIADLGLSLIDFPVYSNAVKNIFADSDTNDSVIANTNQLLKKIKETPPRSESTFTNLLQLPEQYLQTGNSNIAMRVLIEIQNAAKDTSERFRKSLQEKIDKTAKRIAALGKPFPLDGNQIDGKPLRPTTKDSTLVIFWSPNRKDAMDTLVRIDDSSVYDQWSTEILVASSGKLTSEAREILRSRFFRFRIVDLPTSMSWIKKFGIAKVPYLMIVNKNGIIERFSTPE